MGKEVDMVYSRTAGGGFRFAFNFEFEWELLPGIPGQVQDGYAENTSYGAYGDHGGSSYGGASNGKPSYGKPSGASYGTDAKPAYGKPSGGDGDNKPAPGYAKPTYKPAPKPTYKPATKPTYKPAPKPTYKPTQKPTYKPTTKYTTEKTTKYTTEATTKYTTEKTTKYTTEKTTKYTTEATTKYTTKYTTPKPYKPTKKPYTNKPYGGGGKPPLYKPVAGCPWETNHGYSSYAGDCPGHQGKCNLKYFKVCGQSFFNAVYNDVCKWQDAAQLIPMVTSKLVPLGAKFERVFNTKCNGLNKEGKSLMELMGGPVEDDARDVASCKAVAGAVPCEYINFHGVTTARQFHLKVEKLYYDYLKDLCNKEWQVHFEALMVRMRASLFCDDGSQPDHAGYTPSQAPPPYNAKPPKPTQGYTPDNTPAPYKPQEPQKPYQPPQPTQAPYKPPTQKPQDPYRPPQPTQKPYNPPQPTQPPYKPPTQPPQPTQPPYKPPTQPPQKPYNPPKPNKPYKPPMYKPVTNCPWEKPNGLEGDCPANPEMCNLKYFKVCGENFFNKVYNDVCHWQDAAQLIPMVTKMLVPLGARYENKNGKCNGMNYGAKSIQELMGGPVPDSERDIAQCKPVAGAVPCHYIDFSGVTSARTFHLKVEKLYHDFLKQHCNKEWQVHFEALMIRMRNSLFCPDGNSDHEGYMPSPPPPPYKPTQPPTTYKPKPPVTPKPYNPPKPNPPKPNYNGGNNNNNNGYGDKPVTVDGYTQYPGPMNNKGYCPWNKGAYNGSGYPKDCKKDNKCNLKYAGRCLNNLFNKVYKDICKWQEAGKLQKDINAFFVQLGQASEKAYNVKCDYSVPQKYGGMRNNRYADPSMDYYFEDEKFEFEFLDGENPDFADYGRRRRQASRQVPACEKWAGIIPCDLVNFHDAKNELDYYHKVSQNSRAFFDVILTS